MHAWVICMDSFADLLNFWHVISNASFFGYMPFFRKIAEEVGQLSREFFDQSNRAVFEGFWLRFFRFQIYMSRKKPQEHHKYSYIAVE